ncbi:MAG: 50S ribosomal protein L11 methyltransferase [Pseudomonadota bacterium]
MKKYWTRITIKSDLKQEELLFCVLQEIGITSLEVKSLCPYIIFAYFEGKKDIDLVRNNLIKEIEKYPIDDIEISIDFIEEENWQDNWKQYFKPQYIGENIVVAPPWEDNFRAGLDKIIIEPALCFGTGTHESTKIALMLLEFSFKQTLPKKILDIGCGSGILSIYAALKKVSEIFGIDVDENSPIQAFQNLERNLSRTDINELKIGFEHNDVMNIDGKFDFIIANVISRIQENIQEQIKKLLSGGKSRIILSGILNKQLNKIKSYYIDDFNVINTCTMNEWCGILIQRKR